MKIFHRLPYRSPLIWSYPALKSDPYSVRSPNCVLFGAIRRKTPPHEPSKPRAKERTMKMSSAALLLGLFAVGAFAAQLSPEFYVNTLGGTQSTVDLSHGNSL